MAQTWNVPPTGTSVFGTVMKTDIPNALESLRTLFSGGSAPSSTVAYMLWADTSNVLLKQRDSGDASWDTVAPLNTDLGRFSIVLDLGSVSASVTHRLFAPQLKSAKVLSAHVLSDTASSGSDGSNNWAFQLHNVTDAVDLLATAQDTNGAEIAANTPYDVTADQNQTLDADDVLQLVVTKTGAPTSPLADVQVQLEGTYSI